MKQFAMTTWEKTLLWKMVIAKLMLSVLVIICISLTTVLSPVVWSSLSTQEKFLCIVGIIGLCATNISSFLDKTASQIQEGQLPVGVQAQRVVTEKAAVENQDGTVTVNASKAMETTLAAEEKVDK